MSGVGDAWTIDDIIDRRASENPEAMRRNTHIASSGDVIVSILPGWQEVDDDDNSDDRPQTTQRAAAALSPAFILAPGVKAQKITATVDARAIAPTVTGLLRIRSPNGAASAPVRLQK